MHNVCCYIIINIIELKIRIEFNQKYHNNLNKKTKYLNVKRFGAF